MRGFWMATLPVILLACGDDPPAAVIDSGSDAGDSGDAGTDTHADATQDVDDGDVADSSDDAAPDGDEGSDVEGSAFEPIAYVRDDSGAALVLRGVNVSSASKADPEGLARIGELDATRIARGWGFNFVRYLIFWEYVEPEPGEIDYGYLEAVEARLDLFADAGVHVLLDMHQDVYARRFCCDGAPEWAIRDDGLPFVLQESWFANYFQPAVKRAFDNFFDAEGPHADLQEHYRGAWVAVAEALGDHRAVIGYDLMNEPFPGSLFDLNETLSRTSPRDGGSSRRFDETRLGPFYQRLIDAIRTVDDETWIFYESRYGAPGNGSPSYLPRLVDPREGEPRLVYAPHLYSVALEANNAYGRTDRTISEWARQREADFVRQGHPTLIGEWGLPWSAVDAERFAREVLDLADANVMGWAYWSYDPSDESGWGLWNSTTLEENPAAAVLARPFASRWPGDPVSMAWNPNELTLTMVIDSRPEIEGALEVRVPGRFDGESAFVRVEGASAGSWSSAWSESTRTLSIVLPATEEPTRWTLAATFEQTLD